MSKPERVNTPEDAALVIKRFNHDYVSKICPLMYARCDDDCICFKPARMVGTCKPYYIYPPGCTNPMLGMGCKF